MGAVGGRAGRGPGKGLPSEFTGSEGVLVKGRFHGVWRPVSHRLFVLVAVPDGVLDRLSDDWLTSERSQAASTHKRWRALASAGERWLELRHERSPALASAG